MIVCSYDAVPLEKILETKLNLTCCGRGTGYSAKSSIGDPGVGSEKVCTWLPEIGSIKQIEKLGSELQFSVLAELDVFIHRKVKADHSRNNQGVTA